MTDISLKDKALLTIEGICLASGRAELDSIYTFAHVANGHCENPHEDWVRDLDATYKQLKKDGVI
jgi:hypothetical protein